MKVITFQIILITLLSPFTTINESDEYLIIKSMLDYVDNWETSIDKKFSNTDFLDEINMTEQTYGLWDSIRKGIHGGLYIEDSLLIVENSEFDYIDLRNKLKKTHKRKLKNKIRKKNSIESRISFSYPVISIDGTSAIVYLNTYTNPLAASVELFLLKKNDEKWVVKNRFVKKIS